MRRRMAAAAAAAVVSVALARSAAGQQVSFSVDPTAGRSAVSPLIYGVNPGQGYGVANPGLNQAAYAGLNLTSERIGGNRWTAYNYTNNASNAGSDYVYSNDGYLGGGATPAGAVLPFVRNAAAAGATPVVTVPMAGYVSADKSGSVGTASTLAAPGSSPHFVASFPNAAADPSPAAGHVYQNNYVQLVANAYAPTASGRPLVFMLDNEPDLWSSTHPEVHPAAVTYAELLSRSVSYAAMIKATAPNAQVFGPASYGWNGFTSLQNASDAGANGNFINYYLKGMSAASASAGTRLLDALDLHWYPEAKGSNGVRITADDTSAATVAARLQAPRSLWDPTYVENSWITQSLGNKAINLIPLMQGRIAANYAGTKLSISEYNYGAGESISGGLAEADVLGVFGKYGVYSAQEWPLQANEQFTLAAMRMFRNYDGANGAFGDTEVSATNSDTVNSSVYASVDAANPDHLTLVLINKAATATTATVNLANAGRPESAAAYQLTAASAAPVSAGTVAIPTPAGFAYAMPAYSVTTLSLTSDQWLPSTGGSWATGWSAAVPDGVGAHANFLTKPTGLTAAGTVTLDGNRTVGRIVFDDPVSYTVAAGTGGTVTVNDGAGGSPSVTVYSGSHTIAAPVSLAAGLTVTTAANTALAITGNVTGTGGLTVAGGGAVTLGGTDDYGPTTVNAGAKLTVAGSVAGPLTSAGATTFAANAGPAVLVRSIGTLSVPAGGSVVLATGAGRQLLVTPSVAVGGTVDLGRNDLDVTGGDAAGVTAAVARAFAGGTWAGGGLTSSAAAADGNHLTAVGVLSDAGGAYATFDGRAVSAGDVLVRFTVYGDADLSGVVTAADYARLDAGFLSHGSGWENGDFNYDGVVDGSDYTLADGGFNRQTGGIGSPTAELAGGATVPEPAGAAVAVAVGWAVGRRRRR